MYDSKALHAIHTESILSEHHRGTGDRKTGGLAGITVLTASIHCRAEVNKPVQKPTGIIYNTSEKSGSKKNKH